MIRVLLVLLPCAALVQLYRLELYGWLLAAAIALAVFVSVVDALHAATLRVARESTLLALEHQWSEEAKREARRELRRSLGKDVPA